MKTGEMEKGRFQCNEMGPFNPFFYNVTPVVSYGELRVKLIVTLLTPKF